MSAGAFWRLGCRSSIKRKLTMSHFTTIKTQIKDIEALRAACTELGFNLLKDAEARGYAHAFTRGDYVIRLSGPYDIAVNRSLGDAHELTTDWWGGHVEKETGPAFGKLLQLYGVHKATAEARKKGLSVLRRAKKDGSIKLILLGAF
jgi:hypothetical protein